MDLEGKTDIAWHQLHVETKKSELIPIEGRKVVTRGGGVGEMGRS